METRYNLKSPGERGWGGWGSRAGALEARSGASAGSRTPGSRGYSGFALYARPLRVPGCRPQGGAAAAEPQAGCRPLAPDLPFPVPAEWSWRRSCQGQVYRRRQREVLTVSLLAVLASSGPSLSLPSNFVRCLTRILGDLLLKYPISVFGEEQNYRH